MELHQLRYFIAVAETLSFTRAARRCHVAQPSLSQQIKKLEDELGMPLFERLPRRVRLAEGGQALLPRAKRIIAEVNAVDAALHADVAAGAGSLRVGGIPTMTPYLLPRLVSRFTRKFPNGELTVREDFTERLVEALNDHELDVAVMSTPVEHHALTVEVLGAEQLLVTAARDFPLHDASQGVTLRHLQDQPTVVLQEMHCLGQQIESFCTKRSIERRIVCETTQLETALRLVGLGLGISLVPEMCARADKSETRQYVRLGRKGPQREIAVVYRNDHPLSALAESFIDLLRRDLDSGAHRYAG